MKLENQFTIDAPASQVWTTMLDFERVSGCVPGSQVIGPAEGDGLEANIRVKVGPMVMSYRGVVAIVEQDESLRRAVMQAKARESRGQGTANARMVMEVHDGTPVSVSIATDLDVSGRVAQMGRGVMQEVAGRIVDDFAKNLQGVVRADGLRAEAATADPARDAVDGTPVPLPVVEPPSARESQSALSARKLAVGVIQGRLRALRDWLRARLARRR